MLLLTFEECAIAFARIALWFVAPLEKTAEPDEAVHAFSNSSTKVTSCLGLVNATDSPQLYPIGYAVLHQAVLHTHSNKGPTMTDDLIQDGFGFLTTEFKVRENE